MASTETGNTMNIFWKIISLLLLLGALDIGRYVIYPDVSSLKHTNPIPSAFMEYRQEQWASENREMQITQKWVTMNQISPNIIKAVLIGEDDGFYHHDGFDVKGMENAIERSIKKKTLAGGSTISQQLSKNLYLSPSKNPIRKLKEAIITWRIEKTLSKRRILELYLNIAEWGDGIFGIEAAARHYYHKSAKNLSGDEAAHLAAVLPNPIKYNPIGNQKYVINRSRIILKTMKRRGVIQSYKEVMTPTKEDSPSIISTEANDSIESLFNSSSDNSSLENTTTPPTENSDEPSVVIQNDENNTQ
jgi:monofunctional glycosyltransferase